jgi:hypothetical protein
MGGGRLLKHDGCEIFLERSQSELRRNNNKKNIGLASGETEESRAPRPRPRTPHARSAAQALEP